MEVDKGGRVIGLESDVAQLCQILHERFNHLTDLRTMTAHRHITLIGVVGAVLAGVSQFGEQKDQELIVRLLPYISWILIALGICVTVYDAMIRQRARAVTLEMLIIVAESGLPVDQKERQGFFPCVFRHLGEDFFFFSQIIVVNGLAAVPQFTRTGINQQDFAELASRGLGGFFVAAVLFGALWFAALEAYSRWGPASTWLPRA